MSACIMACVAPAWPSQRRTAASQSERHTALARMRQRRTGRDSTPEPPEAGWLSARGAAPELDRLGTAPCRRKQAAEDLEDPLHTARPTMPAMPKPPGSARGDPMAMPPLSARPGTTEGNAAPWDPAWVPDSPGAKGLGSSIPEPPRGNRKETPRSDSCRVRGPAEVRAARGEEADVRQAAVSDAELPPGAKGADFKTLQQMIAKGIQEAETGVSTLEKTFDFKIDEAAEQRHRNEQRKRHEAELESKNKEREAARARRRREEEERSRKQQEELDRWEQDQVREREEKKATEAQCRREHAACSRIQARVRGRRSRAGKSVSILSTKPSPHETPRYQPSV